MKVFFSELPAETSEWQSYDANEVILSIYVTTKLTNYYTKYRTLIQIIKKNIYNRIFYNRTAGEQKGSDYIRTFVRSCYYVYRIDKGIDNCPVFRKIRLWEVSTTISSLLLLLFVSFCHRPAC